jgi:CheY-like chemotaxis protein
MNAAQSQSPNAARCRGQVLVVDDDLLLRTQFVEVLSEHNVLAVASAADALRLIETGSTFDVVLCGPTAVGLLADLWRRRPDQAERLVFMLHTGGSPSIHLVDSAANLCIEMPTDIDGLRALIERRRQAPVFSPW